MKRKPHFRILLYQISKITTTQLINSTHHANFVKKNKQKQTKKNQTKNKQTIHKKFMTAPSAAQKEKMQKGHAHLNCTRPR